MKVLPKGSVTAFLLISTGNFVADDVAELGEIVARDVGDERAERIVEADEVAGDAFVADDGGLAW